MNTHSSIPKPQKPTKPIHGQTGPRTAEGKARSSRNAVKHGLRAQAMVLPGEDIVEYEAFVKDVVDSLNPVSAASAELARQIASTLWMLRRIEIWQVTSARVSIAATAEDDQVPIKEIDGQIAHHRGTIASLQRDPGLDVPLIVRLGDRPDAELVDALDVLGMYWDLSEESHNQGTDDGLQKVCSAIELPEEAVKDPTVWDGWTIGLARRTAQHVLAPSETMLTDHISDATEDWKSGLDEQRARRRLECRRIRKEIDALELKKQDLLAVQTIPEPSQQDTLIRYETANLLKLNRLQKIYASMQTTGRKRETRSAASREE